MTTLVDFNTALDKAPEKERHILLGNGFSISCKPEIFSYSKLWEQAEKNGLLKDTLPVFDRLGTSDFEKVIRALRDASRTLAGYPGIDEAIINRLHSDANALRETLVTTIANHHPDQPAAIADAEYDNCRNFLRPFSKIFSTSYDLVLYWTIMHGAGPRELNERNDGFKKPLGDGTADYVVWEPGRTWFQNTFYLHGALHIYDNVTEVKKFTWSNTQVRLIDQVRDALSKDYFPIFVAEGTSDEKYSRIRHSDYLAKSYTELYILRGTLFVFGHSLKENDYHISRAIAGSKVDRLYVGLFGDPSTPENRDLIDRATAIAHLRESIVAETRSQTIPALDVFFYDSSTVTVWR